MDGVISNIQRFSMHDGPGVRSTVFFKGCPLRCAWCHNPETYTFGPELRYNKARCIGCGACVAACGAGALSAGEEGLLYDKDACAHCLACVGACPGGALAVSGRNVTVEDVLGDVAEDMTMYQRTGGGVTLSGGEPTAQSAFCDDLLTALAERCIHTCLDTCGYCNTDTFLRLARKADMVLFDIKHTEPGVHRRLTGASNELVLKNLRALEAAAVPVEVRVPVIPTLNDDEVNLARIARMLAPLRSVRSIVILGYHTLGQSKIYDFDRTGADLSIDVPKQAALERIANRMRAASGKVVTYR